ncbi:MAG: ATP synthase F0 subunit B [Desulfobulbaceae bacterium]|jgi:F-type H+-transporting ATPase subunit b|nr:ATP synthase F0 subunit B [Desulfobulbaceae bacterium]
MVVFLFYFAGIAFGSSGGITVIPDESVFIQIVNFLLIIWILNLVLYKPIRNILIQRKEKIAGLDQNIETINRDAKEKDDAFASGIKEARSKGLKEKEALLQEGAGEEREIIEKINQKAQADLAEMREKIAKDAEDVRTSLQKEIDAFANAIGEKILGRAV